MKKILLVMVTAICLIGCFSVSTMAAEKNMCDELYNFIGMKEFGPCEVAADGNYSAQAVFYHTGHFLSTVADIEQYASGYEYHVPETIFENAAKQFFDKVNVEALRNYDNNYNATDKTYTCYPLELGGGGGYTIAGYVKNGNNYEIWLMNGDFSDWDDSSIPAGYVEYVDYIKCYDSENNAYFIEKIDEPGASTWIKMTATYNGSVMKFYKTEAATGLPNVSGLVKQGDYRTDTNTNDSASSGTNDTSNDNIPQDSTTTSGSENDTQNNSTSQESNTTNNTTTNSTTSSSGNGTTQDTTTSSSSANDVTDNSTMQENATTNSDITEDVKDESDQTSEKVFASADDVTIQALESVFSADTVVSVEQITDENKVKTITEHLKETATNFVVYEITATSNGVSVQPNGIVKATFPIPNDFNVEKVQVLYVSEEGNIEVMPSAIDKENKTITAELSHFSTYVVSEKAEIPDTDDVVSNKEKEQTETTGTTGTASNKKEKNIAVWIVISIIIVLAGAGAAWYFLWYKKKNLKGE